MLDPRRDNPPSQLLLFEVAILAAAQVPREYVTRIDLVRIDVDNSWGTK